MSFKLRKLLCLVVLIVWLPVYIFLAAMAVSQFDRPHILIEAAIYMILGILWALPFRPLFRGIGRPDPNAPPRVDDQP